MRQKEGFVGTPVLRGPRTCLQDTIISPLSCSNTLVHREAGWFGWRWCPRWSSNPHSRTQALQSQRGSRPRHFHKDVAGGRRREEEEEEGRRM